MPARSAQERMLFMSGAKRQKKNARRPSVIGQVAKGLYIVLFVLSLVIVVSFVALNVFAPAPTVDSQVTFNPGPKGAEQSDPPSEVSGEPEATPTPLVLNRRDGVYTCLLLGVADMGGTDTIMLGVFDTQGKTASLISIPRDTVVYYNGKYQKVNATYAGGEEAVVDAVSDLLGVPVDFWMSINLKAFESVVNQIGGVYFTVPVDMDYEDPYQDLAIHIKAGYQLLNGKQAVGVMRCRNCYPSADIGRSATQRAFLTALVKQTVTLSNASKVTSLINTFSQYVSTNMPLNDMVYFGTQAIGMDLDSALNASGLPGEWTNPYWELDDEAVLELVNGLGIYKEEVPAQVLHIVHP